MYRVFLFFFIVLFSFSIPESIIKKIDKEIEKVFNIKNYSKELILFDSEISSKLLVPFNNDNFFKIIENDSLIGYFYYGKAPSKTDEFDFLVVFDENLIIKKSKILAYREDYGMEIGSKRWLNQFNNLSKADQIIYNKDIKAISGATISAKSMTKAINDLLKSLAIIQNKNRI